MKFVMDLIDWNNQSFSTSISVRTESRTAKNTKVDGNETAMYPNRIFWKRRAETRKFDNLIEEKRFLHEALGFCSLT